MKDSEKNRCPDRARKRAASDLRCALRKLGLLDELERLDPQKSYATGTHQALREFVRIVGGRA